MDPRQKPSEATVLKSLHGSVSGRSLSSHTSVFMVITPYMCVCVCVCIYNTGQKFGKNTIFNVFLKESIVSSVHKACISLIKNTEITVILWNIITIFYFNKLSNVVYSCDQNWIFSFITPVFSVTWSFTNHSNYYQCWKQLCCLIFFITCDTLLRIWWMNLNSIHSR